MLIKLTPAMWGEIRSINSEVNRRVRYKTDAIKFDTDEFWEIADREGDCEDYALAKRKLLLDRGFPVDAIRLAICEVPGAGGHCVLTIDTDLGCYVLDNIAKDVTPWKNLDYRWLYRQVPGKRKWQKLEN